MKKGNNSSNIWALRQIADFMASTSHAVFPASSMSTWELGSCQEQGWRKRGGEGRVGGQGPGHGKTHRGVTPDAQKSGAGLTGKSLVLLGEGAGRLGATVLRGRAAQV